MAEAQKVTAPSSRVIVDVVALQQALRAAKAIAPSNPKTEHAVIGVQVPTADNETVVVTAMNPELHLMMSVPVPTIDVDLADARDAHIEIDRKQLDGLLSMPRKTPKQDDPWPEMCWDVTPTRIKQTDAHVLLGRRTDVRREGREQHVLGDITGTLSVLTDAVPDAKGHGRATVKQIKAVGAAMGHIGQDPTSLPLDPGEGQEASLLWLSPSAMVHSTIPAPDAREDSSDSGLKAAAQDLHDTMKKSGATLTIVNATPPGGIA